VTRKGKTMAQWINHFWNNSFVNYLCYVKKLDPYQGLTTVRQSGRHTGIRAGRLASRKNTA